MSTQKLEQNKQTVTAFCDLMFNQCQPAEAVDKYVGDVYIQHNPIVADGEQAFIAYFIRMAPGIPRKARPIQTRDRRGQLCGAAL